SADTYDYINCIEMIEESVDDITSFLASKRNMYPNFRSAETGYSFEDLQQRYEYISNNNIPELYAIVFGQRLTKNHEALVKNYQNRLDNSIMEINNLDDHIEKERAVLDQLGDKVTKS